MKLPRYPAAVVFDMDGLIFDTEILYRESVFAAAAEGGHEFTEEIHQRMLGCPWSVIRGQLLDHYGEDFPIETFRESWHSQFRAMAEERLALKTGVIELLDELDRLNIPRAIATSSFRDNAEHHLDKHGIRHRFDYIVTQGDYAAGKPAPDPYLKAAELLKIEPAQCLALEDSHNGIRSASSAGMMAVMVPDLLSPNDEMHRLCAAIADDLHHVRSLVLAAQ